MALTLPQRILAETLTFVCFIRTRDETGLYWWVYLAVPGMRMEQLQHMADKENFVPEHYGKVLARGYDEPSAEVQETMEKDYGCIPGKTLGIYAE